MTKSIYGLIGLNFFIHLISFGQNVPTRSAVTDTFFGIKITDSYRWLESINSDATQTWLKEQLKITRKEKMNFSSSYTKIYEKLNKYPGSNIISAIKQSPYDFILVHLQEYGVQALFYRRDEYTRYTPVLNTHNVYETEQQSIEGFKLSDNKRYLAISLSKAGSDWREIVIHDMDKDKNLNEVIKWVKFSNLVWYENGFFYSRFKGLTGDQVHVAANTQQQLCYHRLGDLQQNDKVIYTIPEKANHAFRFDITSDKKHLVINSVAKISGVWSNIVAYKNLDDGLFSELKMFITSPQKEDVAFNVVDLIEEKFVVHTNLDAPNYRLLYFQKHSLNQAEELVPEFDEVLRSIHHIGKKLFGLYFSKGTFTGVAYNYEGQTLRKIPFVPGDNVDGFRGEPDDTVVSYFSNSFYTAPVVFDLNLKTYKRELKSDTKVRYDETKYITQIVNVKSKDGTDVPMYMTYKRGLKRNGEHPVILYGYGGYGVSVDPFYSYDNILLFENNGILAVPLIRGGGELGKTWHTQGKGLNKQNSFDDFIAAAEYLIDSGYTRKERLAIKGRSNGGLLIGAVLTQRPDLFGAAIGEMGAYDMLRYHHFTGGRFLEDEYGTSDDSIQFMNLLRYSPLHKVHYKIGYPATLLVTAENDDRVPPLHSYKFLAALQQKSDNDKPHILYFEEDAGHSGSNKLDNVHKLNAFTLAFIFSQMNVAVTTDF